VLPDVAFPPGMSIYAQGVALGDFGMLLAFRRSARLRCSTPPARSDPP
jgi:hypothetical protein